VKLTVRQQDRIILFSHTFLTVNGSH